MTEHLLAFVDPKEAGAALPESFGSAAGSQALFRAFMAERDHKRLATWFWIEVFWSIVDSDTHEQNR
jgi:hypothetical protein